MSDSNGVNGSGNGADPEPVSGTAAAADLAARTLRGDLRDRILDFVRRQKQPWALLNEEQQTGVVGEVTRIAGKLVDGAVAVLATRDFPAITARVRDCKAGEKGIEAKVVLASHDPFRHALMDSVGSPVQIVLADPALFYGARGLAAIDPDEPELPLANGLEEGAEEETEAAEPPAPAAEAAPEQTPKTEYGPYNAGFDAAREGVESDANPYEWFHLADPEYRDALLWLAGWYMGAIEGTPPGTAKNDLLADAIAGFGRLGSQFAEAGGALADNPLDEWMPPHGWWANGWRSFEGAGADPAPKRPRGRPRKPGRDEPRAPA